MSDDADGDTAPYHSTFYIIESRSDIRGMAAFCKRCGYAFLCCFYRYHDGTVMYHEERGNLCKKESA